MNKINTDRRTDEHSYFDSESGCVAKDPVFDGRYCCFIYVSAKILKEEPAKIAALLRAIHKAEAWIAEHPEETVDIIAEGKYSEIEDKPLAVELIKSYVYTSLEQRKTLGRDSFFYREI